MTKGSSMLLNTSQFLGTNFAYQNFTFDRYLDDMRRFKPLWGCGFSSARSHSD
jgi:hypothetical protein